MLRRIGKNEKNGVWGLGCVEHGMLDNDDYLAQWTTVPEKTEYTAGETVGQWI